MALFSIITVSYNSAVFLEQTINSVLSLDYDDFEYIIGDDCSADDSWNIIERYIDPRILKYRNEANIGEYPNRMRALEKCTGRYVIYIDGDDIIYPHALTVIARYVMQFPECAMVFFREWDSRILCPFKVDPIDIYRFEYLDRGIMGGNFTKVLFKTEILKQYSFPPGIRSGDTYIQLMIAQKFPGLVIQDGLTWWRRRKGNATEQLFSDHRYLSESIKYEIDMLGRNCPLSEKEIEWAKVNIYGIYLRRIVRMMLFFKWRTVRYLMKRIHIPSRYYKCLFVKSRHGYFDTTSGDKPLHSKPGIF